MARRRRIANETSPSGRRSAERQRAEEEYRRLLYVGMTRAEDRLDRLRLSRQAQPPPAQPGTRGQPRVDRANCRLIVHPVTGQEVHRYQVASGAAPAEPLPAEPSPPAVRAGREPPAGLAARQRPMNLPLPRPLSPSRAAAAIEDGEAAAAQRSPVLDALRPSLRDPPRPGDPPPAADAARGCAGRARAAAAARYLADRSGGSGARPSAETLVAVDAHPRGCRLRPLFAPGSRAEVGGHGHGSKCGGRERVDLGQDRPAGGDRRTRC